MLLLAGGDENGGVIRTRSSIRKDSAGVGRKVVYLFRPQIEKIAAIRRMAGKPDPKWPTEREVIELYQGRITQYCLSRWKKWCIHLDGPLETKTLWRDTGTAIEEVDGYSRDQLDIIDQKIAFASTETRRFVGLHFTDESGEWASRSRAAELLGISAWKLRELCEDRWTVSDRLPEGRLRVKLRKRPSSKRSSNRKIKVYHLGDARQIISLRDQAKNGGRQVSLLSRDSEQTLPRATNLHLHVSGDNVIQHTNGKRVLQITKAKHLRRATGQRSARPATVTTTKVGQSKQPPTRADGLQDSAGTAAEPRRRTAKYPGLTELHDELRPQGKTDVEILGEYARRFKGPLTKTGKWKEPRPDTLQNYRDNMKRRGPG